MDNVKGIKCVREKDRFPVKTGTYDVFFNHTPEFIDPDQTDACVRVMTSDGHRGTCSHLNIYHNPGYFAQDLRVSLGCWDKIPAVISGGLDRIKESRDLVDDLIEALKENGFIVSIDQKHSDIGGAFSRAATLRRDGVTIRRKAYGVDTNEETIELTFPPCR